MSESMITTHGQTAAHAVVGQTARANLITAEGAAQAATMIADRLKDDGHTDVMVSAKFNEMMDWMEVKIKHLVSGATHLVYARMSKTDPVATVEDGDTSA